MADGNIRGMFSLWTLLAITSGVVLAYVTNAAFPFQKQLNTPTP